MVLNNNNLLVKVGTNLYDWKTASTIIVSLIAFQQMPPDNVISNVAEVSLKEKYLSQWS